MVEALNDRPYGINFCYVEKQVYARTYSAARVEKQKKEHRNSISITGKIKKNPRHLSPKYAALNSIGNNLRHKLLNKLK